MGTTADKLARVLASKADIASAISEKGGTVPARFADYGNAIRALPSGGGNPFGESRVSLSLYGNISDVRITDDARDTFALGDFDSSSDQFGDCIGSILFEFMPTFHLYGIPADLVFGLCGGFYFHWGFGIYTDAVLFADGCFAECSSSSFNFTGTIREIPGRMFECCGECEFHFENGDEPLHLDCIGRNAFAFASATSCSRVTADVVCDGAFNTFGGCLLANMPRVIGDDAFACSTAPAQDLENFVPIESIGYRAFEYASFESGDLYFWLSPELHSPGSLSIGFDAFHMTSSLYCLHFGEESDEPGDHGWTMDEVRAMDCFPWGIAEGSGIQIYCADGVIEI